MKCNGSKSGLSAYTRAYPCVARGQFIEECARAIDSVAKGSRQIAELSNRLCSA